MIDQVSGELDSATREVSGIEAGLKRYDEPLAQEQTPRSAPLQRANALRP